MPLNPTNQNKTGILLPNPTAPRFDTAFAAGNRGTAQPTDTLPIGYIEATLVGPINTGPNSVFNGHDVYPDAGDKIAFNPSDVWVGGNIYFPKITSTLSTYESGLITAPVAGTYTLYVKDMSDSLPIYEPFQVTVGA
jgi:hypothetical protein